LIERAVGKEGTSLGLGAGLEAGIAPVLPQSIKELRTRGARNLLPACGMPRGLSRVQAAAYVGISPTLFDRAVEDGKMPKPFRLYARVLWDIRKLDVAITALDTEDAGNDVWGSMAL
jgi:predicted DNA-binding transcriptional regulator AlpA